MKIYTRRGDQGETGLFGGARVGKNSIRVHAYGEVDELNATLGLALTHIHGSLKERIRKIQEDLFSIGAHLSADPTKLDRVIHQLPNFPGERIAEMENWIDEADEALPPLRAFILPGGSPAGAVLHLARTVCRRAERAVVALQEVEPVADVILNYLNRLSDYLFMAARLANHQAGIPETEWMPAKRKA